jgi:alpha-D-ribose 1-methylphosphonate 5-triphosphate synthase subunit PhnG
MNTSATLQAERQVTLSLLAKAPQARVPELLDAAFERPAFTWLRTPEIGSVMVRGRAGGTGAPFNLGEMTITRCTLRLATGEVGHAYVQGRRKADAEASAIIDALMQTDKADLARTAVLGPLQAEMAKTCEKSAAKSAATKVDFFTLVRGED